MIDIDLLPPEYKPKKIISLPNIIIVVICLAIVLSLFFSSSRLLAVISNYSARVQDLDSRISHYTPLAEAVRQIKGRIRELTPRLILAKELLQGRTTWSDKLIELYHCLPGDGIWLDEVSIKSQEPEQQKGRKSDSSREEAPAVGPQQGSTGPITVYISGSVVSVDRVGEFVANLEDSRTFGNVVFDSATSGGLIRTGTGGANAGVSSLINFRLTVQIEAPEKG